MQLFLRSEMPLWFPLPHCLLCCSSATLRKPALRSNAQQHTTPVSARAHPHMPQQKARQHAPRARWRPASRARAAPAAPRWPTAGNPACATASRRGCPSGTALRRGHRSRGDVPSIGLAAGEHILQAPGMPPAPAPGTCRAVLQNSTRYGPQFVAASPSTAGVRSFNRVQAHIPGTDHDSPGGHPCVSHAAVPSDALHLRGHFAKLSRAKISVLWTLLTVATP